MLWQICAEQKGNCMSLQDATSPIRVSELYVYPMKSCRGQSLRAGIIDARGFEHDRSFMLVDESAQQLDGRRYPRLLQVELSVEDSSLELSAPGVESLRIACRRGGPYTSVAVWGNPCQATDQGDEAAQWFGALIGVPCRLARMADDFKRPSEGHEQVGFVDASPFLLISQASLDDLNKRLNAPVSMRRFRPNIVLSGTSAFAEDQWQCIRIGEYVFDFVWACKRCVMTTIDPDTLKGGKEPLKTLATYRRDRDGDVIFGQYVNQQQAGIIRVGDAVEILSVRELEGANQ